MRRMNRSMLDGPLLPSIIQYTIPIILTSLLQLLFNAADLVIVGQFCGSISVGAVGSTGAITNLIVNLFVGLSVGAGVTVAQGIGRNDIQGVQRTVHTALPLALISGVILTGVGVAFAKTFLQLMDTPENVLPLSAVYMRIYFGGITFNMVYNFCAAILRAAGDTKSPLMYLTLAGIINVILNLFFVTIFHMNVAGVALATTISQGVAAALVVRALMHRTDACQLVLSKMKIHKAQLQEIARIGLPSGIQGSLFSISNVMIQSSINSFGDAMIAGNAAAGNIEGFVYVILNAFHQAAINFVGQNAGARQYSRVKKIFLLCLLCVTVAGLSVGFLAYSFSEPLLSIYISDSQEAIQYGVVRFTYVCLPYFICGLMDVSTGVLRGIGASVAPMLISVLGVCGIRLGWIFTIFQIPEYHTPQSLYCSYIVSWLFTFVAQTVAFLIIYRKYRKKESTLVDQ